MQTITHTLRTILDTAARQNISTQHAALLLAKEKLSKGRSSQTAADRKPRNKREKDDGTVNVA